jgi:hypothetical protein
VILALDAPFSEICIIVLVPTSQVMRTCGVGVCISLHILVRMDVATTAADAFTLLLQVASLLFLGAMTH